LPFFLRVPAFLLNAISLAIARMLDEDFWTIFPYFYQQDFPF
jgi:hypothetical protein